MQSSARLFNCARCRCQVVICSHCDRGNLYCGKRCSQAARRQSVRAPPVSAFRKAAGAALPMLSASAVIADGEGRK